MSPTRRAVLGGSLSMLAMVWARRAHAVEAAGAKDRVRVVFHVPEGEGAVTGALTTDATNLSLGIAEKLLGVPFRRGEDVPLAARFARLETRDDRNKLSALLTAGSVDVFLVTSLRDVDDPRLYRRGVTWTHYATPKAIGPYIVLAEPASPSTLAHELGHFFGLRHVPTKNNLMSYDRSEGEEFLDERQLATVKGLASARLKSKWLLAVP